jgi:hypothetical protein
MAALLIGPELIYQRLEPVLQQSKSSCGEKVDHN